MFNINDWLKKCGLQESSDCISHVATGIDDGSFKICKK